MSAADVLVWDGWHSSEAEGDCRQKGLKSVCGSWGTCRRIAKGAVAALAYCHDREVMHGSMGAGSLLVSTYDDHRWQELVVKLDNFGFARQSSPAGGPSDAHAALSLS